jgi:hypothetical protein
MRQRVSTSELVAGAQLFSFSVYGFTQGLARFEVGYTLLRNGHRLACAGVAPYTGRPAVHRKAAKTTNFYSVASHQSITHRVQNRLYGEFGITLGELVELRSQGFYEITSGHVFA